MTRNPKRNPKIPGQGVYSGDLNYLMEIIRLTQVPGCWEEMQDYWRYRCDTGAIFNWWPSTGTFNFQGPAKPKKHFASKMAIAIHENSGRLDNTIQSGACFSNYHIPIWTEGEAS